MKFLETTDIFNRKVCVNAHYITSICELEDCTRIYLRNNSYIDSQEPFQDIIYLIKLLSGDLD